MYMSEKADRVVARVSVAARLVSTLREDSRHSSTKADAGMAEWSRDHSRSIRARLRMYSLRSSPRSDRSSTSASRSTTRASAPDPSSCVAQKHCRTPIPSCTSAGQYSVTSTSSPWHCSHSGVSLPFRSSSASVLRMSASTSGQARKMPITRCSMTMTLGFIQTIICSGNRRKPGISSAANHGKKWSYTFFRLWA
jgi:hypothetical protein